MTLHTFLCLACLALAGGCADTELPDLTVRTGPEQRVGIDFGAEDPVLGIYMTDPFDQRRP